MPTWTSLQGFQVHAQCHTNAAVLLPAWEPRCARGTDTACLRTASVCLSAAERGLAGQGAGQNDGSFLAHLLD